VKHFLVHGQGHFGQNAQFAPGRWLRSFGYRKKTATSCYGMFYAAFVKGGGVVNPGTETTPRVQPMESVSGGLGVILNMVKLLDEWS
jgi:hypothetical protein